MSMVAWRCIEGLVSTEFVPVRLVSAGFVLVEALLYSEIIASNIFVASASKRASLGASVTRWILRVMFLHLVNLVNSKDFHPTYSSLTKYMRRFPNE